MGRAKQPELVQPNETRKVGMISSFTGIANRMRIEEALNLATNRFHDNFTPSARLFYSLRPMRDQFTQLNISNDEKHKSLFPFNENCR